MPNKIHHTAIVSDGSILDGDEIVFESDEIKKYLFVSEPLKELI